MHLVGFIIRIYHNARSPERQTLNINLFTIKMQQNWFFKKHKN